MAKNINEIINTLPIARRRKIEKMAAQMIAEEITLQCKNQSMEIKIFTDGVEGHIRRSLTRALKRERGERLAPEKIITYEDRAMMEEHRKKHPESHAPKQ